MRSNTSRSNNAFYGVNAGANWSNTSNNTGIGMYALQGLSGGTGTGNTALGYAAGSGIMLQVMAVIILFWAIIPIYQLLHTPMQPRWALMHKQVLTMY